MKRSDMIKLMVEDSDSDFVLTLEQIADRMLASCEKMGMLPPFDESIEESKVGYGAAYLSDEEVRLRYIRHFCKWEPEDV